MTSNFTNPEIIAKMEDGRCECLKCDSVNHVGDGRCESNSITDTVPPYFEVVQVFEGNASRVPTTWLWLCGPCAEVKHLTA
jgi:hypothetical protein